MTEAARSHRVTRPLRNVGEPPINPTGARRGDPHRRLAAAALVRATEDLRLLALKRHSLRGVARAALDVEAQGIVR